MEKFVSSLKRCKKDAVLFNPLRKTKYNQLKKKLRTMPTENFFCEQEGKTVTKRKMKSNTEAEIGKVKKTKMKEEDTVLVQTPRVKKQKSDENKSAKRKNKNNVSGKCNRKPESVITKRKKKNSSRKTKPFTDVNVENKIIRNKRQRNVKVTYNKKHSESKKFKLQKDFLRIILSENKMYRVPETTADDSISEEYPNAEDMPMVNLDSTCSPIVVRRKSGLVTTPLAIQDTGGDMHAQDNDFSGEFFSVMSCFRKGKNKSDVTLETCELSSPGINKSDVTLETCKMSSPGKNKSDVTLETYEMSSPGDKGVPLACDTPQPTSFAEEKEARVVPGSSVSFGLHALPSQGCVMTMKHPSEVYLRGKVDVTVLKGSVEVLGFTLTAENSKNGLGVFCPQRFACLSVASCELQAEVPDTAYVKKLEALKGSYSKLLKECAASDCVLLLRETSSRLTNYLDAHFPIKLFPKVSSSRERTFHKEENVLQCQFELPGADADTKFVTKKDEWDQAVSDMSIFADGSKTVVLGGKGVGKSTFLRFLANSCLSRRGPVLWLDFDPGQAEFTVPGCLSAVLVKEPLLGPNFTHHATPRRMVFLGEIDVSKCPSRYNSCVRHIVEYCLSQPDLQNVPWFINTMGYSTGLGVDLAVSIIRFLRPTNVIHIESKHWKQNFAQPLRSSYVNSYVSTWSNDSTQSDLDYTTYILPSAVGGGFSKSPSLKPKESRELMVLAYLSQVTSPLACSLLSVVPYCSPLGKLVLAVCHEPVERSHTLAAMNGCLVALCSCDSRHVWSNGDPGMAKILMETPVTPCFGFGIVRGVDMADKMLYLTTPLSEEVLSKVNCLLMGAVNLPVCFYFAVEPGSGQVPYVSEGEEQPMGRATRRTYRRFT